MLCRMITYFADHASFEKAPRYEGVLPMRKDEPWPRPPLAPIPRDKRKVRSEVDKNLSGEIINVLAENVTSELPFAACEMRLVLSPWWQPSGGNTLAFATDYKRGYEEAGWDLDNEAGHTAPVYWPAHVAIAKAKVADVLVLELHYIRLDRRLQQRALGPEFVANLQRLAMVEGYNVVVANWVHLPFATVAFRAFGWLDYLYNRDTLPQPGRPRRTWDAFFPAKLGDLEFEPVGKWHLAWSPPATRLWARVRGLGRDDPELMRLASGIQDWVATPDQPLDTARRFHWRSDAYEVLLFVARSTTEDARVHGLDYDVLPAAPFYAKSILHVRNVRAEANMMRLLNAFFVELGRALLMSVTWDVGYGGEPEDLLDLATPAGDRFVYPTWQPGLGAWPYILRYETAAGYAETNDQPAPEPALDEERRSPRRRPARGDILTGESDEDEPIVRIPQPAPVPRPDIYLFRMAIVQGEEMAIEYAGLRRRPRYESINTAHAIFTDQSPRKRPSEQDPRVLALRQDYPPVKQSAPPRDPADERPSKRVRTECLLCGAELGADSGLRTCGVLACALYYDTLPSL
jgi:hypothetical protein